jgi:hypothetical protein
LIPSTFKMQWMLFKSCVVQYVSFSIAILSVS